MWENGAGAAQVSTQGTSVYYEPDADTVPETGTEVKIIDIGFCPRSLPPNVRSGLSHLQQHHHHTVLTTSPATVCHFRSYTDALVAQLVKNPPAMQETPVWFLDREDPLEKGEAPHSSILGLPWWLGGKESTCNAGDTCSIPESGRAPGEKTAAHSSILAWETPWTEEPGGLQPTGSQRVGHDGATKPPAPPLK